MTKIKNTFCVKRETPMDDSTLSIITVNGHDQLEVVRMVAVGDMYRAGLEKNFQKLVHMEDITSSLTDLLNAYFNMDKLDVDAWNRIMELYKPFIERKRGYGALMDFIEGEVW